MMPPASHSGIAEEILWRASDPPELQIYDTRGKDETG